MELSGSEKQVKWANDIIKEAMNVVKFLELALEVQDADKKARYLPGIENMKNTFTSMKNASELIEKYSKYTTRKQHNFEFCQEDFGVKGRLVHQAIKLLHEA